MGTYVKDSGVQRLVRYALVKDSNIWQRCKRIWVKNAGVWQKAYEIEAPPAAQTYTTVGTTAWTRPSGYFDYITVQIWGGGAGGGGGSNNTAAGGGGGWGASGGSASIIAGSVSARTLRAPSAGGKAIALNGYTVTYLVTGTVYGAVS